MTETELTDMLAEALEKARKLAHQIAEMYAPVAPEHMSEIIEADAALAAHASARADVIPVLTAEAMPEEDVARSVEAAIERAAIAEFENDLAAFDDDTLEAERVEVGDLVDRETAWLEAICAEQKRRASLHKEPR